MLTTDVLGTLASLPLLDHVPPAELRRFESGAIAIENGSPLREMWIVVEGTFILLVPRGGSWRKFAESGRGFVAGTMPYSRVRVSPGRVVVEADAAVVQNMIDRARDYRAAQIHDERRQSLGRLAAGFAHELNNPASGASSHARSLARLVDDVQSASRALARARLTDEQLDEVDAIRQMCLDV